MGTLATDGARLREVMALAEGVRSLARQGDLRMVVSDTYLHVRRRRACGCAGTPSVRVAVFTAR